jgi:hypothetical protein
MKMNSRWYLLFKLRPVSHLIALAFLAFVSGCGRDDVKVYRVAKETPSAASPAAMPAGHPDISTSATPQLKWKTPEGWNEVPPGEMRVASFNVKKDGKQADVSVIPLPGTAGGDAANVNRWRGQLGLAPVTPEELQKASQKVEVAGQPAELHDVVGKNPGNSEPTRILGVIQHRDGMAWFFKMTGDDQLVAQQKPAFVELLKSFQFTAAAEAQPSLPPSHPPIDRSATAPAAAAISSEGKPNWQVPSGWKEISGGQFLVAKFVLAGDGGAQAAVNVSMSAGDGGGLAANVNRWRKQLGLSDLSDDELAKSAKTVETTSGKAAVIEMSGTDARTGQPAQLVGAMVTQTGQTWFYKLMGDAKLVAAQKDAFTKFVQSVKY